jgi:hypothetical protein
MGGVHPQITGYPVLGSYLIRVAVGIGIGIEGDEMRFGHEELDVSLPCTGSASAEYAALESISMPIPIPTPREAEGRAGRG